MITAHNKEKRLFSSWGAFTGLGFNSSDIHSVSSHFLSLFRTGSEISKSDTSGLSSATAKSGREQQRSCDVHAAMKVVKDRSYSLTVDSYSRDMALLYGTPVAIWKTSLGESAGIVSGGVPGSGSSRVDLPWCVTDTAADGSWQRDSRCSGFAMRHFNLSMTDPNFTSTTIGGSTSMCSSALFFVGDPCRHTLAPLLDYMPYYFRKKDMDFIWKPLHCRLVPFVPVPTSLSALDYCDVINRSSSSLFQSTQTDISHRGCTSLEDKSDGAQAAAVASLAGICLRSSGIGFIAGFG